MGKIIGYTNDGLAVVLPTKKAVCWHCNGEGRHVNPNIDDGLSSEDFAEDPAFAESYFSGVYDVRCHACDGNNVIDEIDFESKVTPEVKEALDNYLNYQREEAAERSMRSRGIQF